MDVFGCPIKKNLDPLLNILIIFDTTIGFNYYELKFKLRENLKIAENPS